MGRPKIHRKIFWTVQDCTIQPNDQRIKYVLAFDLSKLKDTLFGKQHTSLQRLHCITAALDNTGINTLQRKSATMERNTKHIRVRY